MAGTFRKWPFKAIIWQAQNQFVEACTYTRHKTSIRPRSVVLDFPLKVCFFVLMSVTLYSFDFHYFDFFNLFVNVFLLFKQQPISFEIKKINI